MGQSGADRPIVAMKRGSACGAKGVGHSRRLLGQRETGGTQLSRRKAPAFVEWHEPDEARVSRPDVCPGKASMFSRGQSCRGRSQSPVVRIAEEMEAEPSKPIDKLSPGRSRVIEP